MNLNIREFPVEVVKALKVKSLNQGVTLRQLVISLLGGENVESGSMVKEDKASKVVPRKRRSGGKESHRKADRGDTGKGPQVEPSEAVGGSNREVRGHDPKTCRVYGCGMCKILKGVGSRQEPS